MDASGIKLDSCFGNISEVISEQSPPAERQDARQVSCDYYRKQGDEVIETGSVRSTKPYACADCRYATDRKNNLRRHRATMHERCERALECCGLSFVSKSELREHVTANHGAGAGYACAECGRRFGRRALMRRHAAVHDGRQSTTDAERRRSTGPVSIGRRRYACSECDYATGHRSNLDRHLRRHAGLHTTAADSRSTFSGDNEPTTLSAANHRDLGVPRTGCCCHICLNALYYHHKLLPSAPPTSSSSQSPFMFNFLPQRLEDVAWGFRKSIVPGVDMRRLWPLRAVDHEPSTEASRDTSNVTDNLSTSKDSDGQLNMVVGLHHRGPGNSPSSSTNNVGDNAPDAAANDVTGDVTGTCYRRRRRLRLLPLLHTCRSCSLTFVSQLQLKFHSDLFHRATELDAAAARPICCRVSQPDVRRS